MADNNDPSIKDEDGPSPKKSKVEGESVQAESSGTYEVIASEYFTSSEPSFFKDVKKKNQFIRDVKEWVQDDENEDTLNLRELKVDQFYKKALESCRNDAKLLKTYFRANINGCDAKLVLDDFNTWKSVSSFGDGPSAKKPKVEGESVEPESSATYKVIASEYFNKPSFFDDADSNDLFNKNVTQWKKNEKKPHVLDLQALSVHEFYTKASESCPNDDKLKVFFHDNIKACDSQAVVDDFRIWQKESGIGIESPPRMVGVGFKIQDTKLSHNYDLDMFSKRIEELFEWCLQGDNVHQQNKLVGPYLCFVQSSGMGKTKLMYEYKMAMIRKAAKVEAEKAKQSLMARPPKKDKRHRKVKMPPKTTEVETTNDKVVALLVLPTVVMDGNDGMVDIFDQQMDLVGAVVGQKNANEAAENVYKKLDAMITSIASVDSYNKIVLLFDESHRLLAEHHKYDAFIFRCVRVWLREERLERPVVAVFAGTNSRLANFIVESDGELQTAEGFSRDSQRMNTKYLKKGQKFNPPFFQTTTMGCCLPPNPEATGNEHACAIYYGRPLFAVMANANMLDGNKLLMVLDRMLLLKNSIETWHQNRNTLINILSTRVQMGQTTMAVASDLVAKGYANLSGYFEESGAAQLAYLPDPVCARLAMVLMDQDFKCRLPPAKNASDIDIKGKTKKWWTEKLTEIFSSGMVSPEKGDFGEVIVALYMLFCGDLLRKRSNTSLQGKDDDNNKNMIQHAYVHFSVSLDEWLHMLQSGGKDHEANHQPPKVCKVSVGFIQVCRNSVRSYGKSWKSLADEEFLQQVYESGTAFYVYPGCPLIDLVIPLRIEAGENIEFVPMVVSIKCRSSFTGSEEKAECEKMENQAKTDELKKILCLLIVFGRERGQRNHTLEEVCGKLSGTECVVSSVISVPNDDIFGLSDAFKAMTPTAQVRAELFASHLFLKTHGGQSEELNSSNAMRSGSSKASLLEYDRLRDALTKPDDHVKN